jgi:uncharacterized protein YrrD
MSLQNNAVVYSSQGNKIGNLSRIVIDPKNKAVTHLVVGKGLLSDEAKVVPISSVVKIEEMSINLQISDEGFERLPDFEKTHYISVDQDEAPGFTKPLYSYPPLEAFGQAKRLAQYPSPPYVRRTEQNIPDGLVALEEGAQVISRDRQKVGQVAGVRVAHNDQATHLVISEGIVLKKRKLVPTDWISHIQEDEIYLAVNQRLLRRLPDYQSLND